MSYLLCDSISVMYVCTVILVNKLMMMMMKTILVQDVSLIIFHHLSSCFIAATENGFDIQRTMHRDIFL